MTDLVSQLVGALNRLYVAAPTGLECNSFHHSKGEFHSHSEPCKPAAEYVEALAQARAALTAAKAGGWVAVPVEPTQAMLDALHSSAYLPGCYRAMLSARPLPNPPKEQSAGGLGSVDAVANPLSPT